MTQNTSRMSTQRKPVSKINKFGNYLDKIIEISLPYLRKKFSEEELSVLFKSLKVYHGNTIQDYIDYFDKVYCDLVKKQYQRETSLNYDKDLVSFIEDSNTQIKLIWGDCHQIFKRMKSESVHIMVTSPPYYNAREYSIWNNLDDYQQDMKEIITEAYRVLDNHRVFVFNEGELIEIQNWTTNFTDIVAALKNIG